jgi:DNA-binding transcriptional MerR regulator
VGGKLMQIGEVSERTGLSLRTVRHYEDVGVVAPSERSHGGFRLYTEAEVRRLALVRRMRPLGFCLDDVRALLDLLDQLPDTGGRPARER